MCCGQKRAELRNSQAQRSTPPHDYGNSQPHAVRNQLPSYAATAVVTPRPLAAMQTRNVQPQPAVPASMPRSSISVRYLENSPIRVRGLVSGMNYEFSGARPIQQVDARDAPSLLSTRFFRRA